jgi:bacteriocin-like protein
VNEDIFDAITKTYNIMKDLSTKELKEIQGGGPIADAVEAVVAWWKCGCRPEKHDGQTWNEYNMKF